MFELAKKEEDVKLYNFYKYLYCKRKYYQAVCLFMANKDIDCGDNNEKKERLLDPIERTIRKIEKLLSIHLQHAADLMIILNLHSSFLCMGMRKLISAENFLNISIKRYEKF